MRILAISNFYPPHSLGGYEQRCRDVVDGLRARGHEVEVLTSTYGVGGSAREGHVERRLPSRWDPRYDRPTRRNLVASELAANRALREALRSFRPELVSVWNMLSIPYSLVATAQRSGLPVVLHIDDDWPLRADPWMGVWSAAHRRWARAVKGAIRPVVDRLLPTVVQFSAPNIHWTFISEYRKRQHLERGLAPPEAPVIPGGISVERFCGQDARPGRPIRLLFAGALTAAKGVDVAIQALGYLAGCEDVTLDIVGPTPDLAYAESLARAVRELGLDGRVRFRGAVDRSEMPALYAQHDLFLFTSVAPEGFPLTILEAMASGLPVVSSVTGGHAEILEDGSNCLTYPAGDAEQLARRIRTLLEQPKLAGSIAAAGQRLVRRELTLERMIDRNECLFREVLGQPVPTECRPPELLSPRRAVSC